ncbi:hypothetical protein CYMTET_15048 [Cymbomonas tetramitiformis]|nr:hypothetical protein CYMTET_15048 [Cymbomonas tetramitiformis]
MRVALSSSMEALPPVSNSDVVNPALANSDTASRSDWLQDAESDLDGRPRPPEDDAGDPVVRMSTSRPTPVSRAPTVCTSAEFHANATVWTSTPVRPSQRSEFAEKLDYAFAYGEKLAKLLRSHGFKPNVGLSLDGPDADEADFAVLLANMSHVFCPISRDEVFKLLDLDFNYTAYHYTINEFIYAVLHTVLRSTAYCLRYEESAHYLVMLRELGTTNDYTFSSLALRLGKILFRDEPHLARLTSPVPPASDGATRAGGGATDTAAAPPSPSAGASVRLHLGVPRLLPHITTAAPPNKPPPLVCMAAVRGASCAHVACPRGPTSARDPRAERSRDKLSTLGKAPT